MASPREVRTVPSRPARRELLPEVIMSILHILYEDEFCAVAVKPQGVPTQPDLTGDPDLFTLFSEHCGHDDAPGLVHRLDRTTGGLLVFSKKQNATAALCAQLQKTGVFRKTYLAVVAGVPQPEEGTWCDYLYKDRSGKAFVVRRPRNGVREASLSYRVLRCGDVEGTCASLVRVETHTGRFHQIRVQFASRRHPLLGDGKYGSRFKGCLPALWATELSFLHPVTGERMSFSFTPDAEFPFSCFLQN